MNEVNAQYQTVIPFHGLLLSVISHENKDYIPLRPIVEMLGTQWKTAREKAFFGDNLELFGTLELEEPIFNAFRTPRGTKKSVHILLESGETYLMKTNSNQIRNNGNATTADYLLALQKEWRTALHNYEKYGYAVKPVQMDKINALVKLDRIKDPTLRRIMAEAVNADFDLNIPLGKQQSMDV